MKRIALAVAVVSLLATPALAGTSRALPGTTCAAFPANSIWHADVSKLPVFARSKQWIAHMSPSAKIHPDFGPSGSSVPYGIPITYVTSSHAKVPVSFTYASESNRVGYPLGSDTKIEGGASSGGDMHAIVENTTSCSLYETWQTQEKNGRWYAGSGATWNLKSNALRPAGYTSADAAGLPILPGLLRYDEVAAGHVDHAIRFTTNTTDRRYTWPARHEAGNVSDLTYPRMGARFRLKASYSIAGLRPDTQTVLKAMKTYGLILADNGSPWYFQGTADSRWADAMLDQLKQIPASAFEAVDVSSLEISSGSGAAR